MGGARISARQDPDAEPSAALWRRALDRVRRAARDHPLVSGWLVSLVFWLAFFGFVLVTRGLPDHLVFDEGVYWKLGSELTDRWSFVGFTSQRRGVGSPLVISWVASGVGLVGKGSGATILVVSLVCLPLLTGVIAPSLAAGLDRDGRRPGLVRILLLDLFVLAFWRNDVVRLLSDLPALTSLAAGVAILARVAPNGRRIGAGAVAAILGAGVLLGFAANVRPAYLAAAVVAVVAVPLLRWGARLGSTVVVALVVVTGLLLGSAPQVVANRQQGAGWSLVAAGSADLAGDQLVYGLRYQRFETYIGGGKGGYTSPAMFHDNVRNLRGLDPERGSSYGNYAGVAVERPVAIAETMLRHAFNGLDIRTPGTYVEDVHAPVVPTQVLNFVLLICALGILGIRGRRWLAGRRRRDRPTDGERHWPVPVWFTIVLLAASAPALVSGVETRFLMGMHVFLGAVVLLGSRRSDLPERPVVRVAAAVAMVVLVGGALALSASVATSLTPPIPPR